jgi:hypothetical protein
MYQVPRVDCTFVSVSALSDSWQLREIIAKVIDHLAGCGVLSTAPVLVSTHVEAVKFFVYFVRLIVFFWIIKCVEGCRPFRIIFFEMTAC